MGKISLRQYVEALFREKDLRDQQRFDAQTTATQAALAAVKEATQAALTAAKEAVVKAENASEKRFEGVNEFRATLSDQAATFISRAEYDALKERMDRGEGRSGGVADGWKWLIAVAALAVPIALYFAK